MAENFFLDNDDLRFYFERGGVDWQGLVELTEYGYRARDGFKSADEALQFYRQVAETVGELTANEVAPNAAKIDQQGVHLENGEAVVPPVMADIFEKIKALEIHGMTLPRELGGQNCPMLLYFLNSEMFARADVSVTAHHGFHGGMAMAMLFFSVNEGSTTFDKEKCEISSTRWRSYIDEIAQGKAWGCMDITEPNAGSDMAKLRAVGEQDESGQWLVSGQKIFITSGHGKYHFVIARTEKTQNPDDPMAGLNGLSMFLVPTYEEDDAGNRRRIVPMDRLEEKLGGHGSVTAALSFERAPAQLIGKRGEGFKYMLTLMNNARIGVGFECLGLSEASYRAARAYAEQRESMGKKILRHEMVADLLDEMYTDIQGVRALAVMSCYHEEMSQKLSLAQRFGISQKSTDDDLARQERKHKELARRYTPLLKYLASENALRHTRTCIQIHGGNGYTRDYPGEKLLRDAVVMPIYEGTSQIQSLMAMKDTLGGIIKNPQRFAARLAQARWNSLSARDPMVRRLAKLESLSLGAQNFLITRTAATKLRSLRAKPVSAWKREAGSWDPKRDFALAMLHAERLTRLLADEAVCQILLDQAQQFPERRAVFERYIERAEVRARALYDEITTTGSRLLAQLSEQAPAEKMAAELPSRGPPGLPTSRPGSQEEDPRQEAADHGHAWLPPPTCRLRPGASRAGARGAPAPLPRERGRAHARRSPRPEHRRGLLGHQPALPRRRRRPDRALRPGRHRPRPARPDPAARRASVPRRGGARRRLRATSARRPRAPRRRPARGGHGHHARRSLLAPGHRPDVRDDGPPEVGHRAALPAARRRPAGA